MAKPAILVTNLHNRGPMSVNSQCPCHFSLNCGLRSGRIIRKGFFRRSSDSKKIQRYFCKDCKVGFSAARFLPTYRQKRRNLNSRVFLLLCSGVGIRRSARLLHCNRKTIDRKLRWLAEQERLRALKATQTALIKASKTHLVEEVTFDEMETSHHTKLKPLSIALAVSPDRVILGFEVSVMPAKGHLAAISRKKYGPRLDQRGAGLIQMLERIKPHLAETPSFLSDQCPRYPTALNQIYPGCSHRAVLSRRACVAGLGELKKGGFDPLFALNHTAASFRANVNRLFRRTWNTTKSVSRLTDHLTLYAAYHNRMISLGIRSTPLPKVA